MAPATEAEILSLILRAEKQFATSLDLSARSLSSLPKIINRLSLLEDLNLMGNFFTTIPAGVCNFPALRNLTLAGNRLEQIPSNIGNLKRLRSLVIGDNQLVQLPSEIGQLRDLQFLAAAANMLSSLPPEIGELASLRELNVGANKLESLPSEVGHLAALELLNLRSNKLTSLPPELGRLRRLKILTVDGNELTDPPKAIVVQGTAAILEYLRARDVDTTRQWSSKLVLVGQGGVGKTCLLRALRGETYREGEQTTHGIHVSELALPHPSHAEITMTLNAWDFGGQDIYNATHQFFLSNRSLFLVVWNARQGFGQSRLYYWLDTIQSLAPGSPVLLVATQIDERDADLPLAELRARYPQILGMWGVSSKSGQGINELRQAVQQAAANLPLMGEPWPSSWLQAQGAVRDHPSTSMSALAFTSMLVAHGLSERGAKVLAGWLHELGEILFFAGTSELEDTVIIKPTWATAIVSRILESEEVIKTNGVLSTEHMRQVWKDLDHATQDYCLRLMERFDLSYRTLGDRDISIVVERLPFEPANYEDRWRGIGDLPETVEVTMSYVLSSTMPAGLPTWFIARQHRFSTGCHWRNGVLFADSTEEHLALVEALPHDRRIRLSVRGPFPQNFFALLRDGLELTMARFAGLKVEKRIPCPGHNNAPCAHEFSYENLLRALHRRPPKQYVECPVGLEDVSISRLLFGIHPSSHDDVIAEMRKIGARQEANQREVLSILTQQRELIQREFLSLFRALQANVDLACPNLFILRRTKRGLLQGLSGAKGSSFGDEIRDTLDWPLVELHLMCQQPGQWHLTTAGGRYTFQRPPAWFQEAAPMLRKMLTCLKVCSPWQGKLATEIALETFDRLWKEDLQFTEELFTSPSTGQVEDDHEQSSLLNGSALRATRRLLEALDKDRHWGGLQKTLTPEGHWLWLCGEHAKEYSL